MNYDELAFANHQLASMLRDGIPLEGGLRQLCMTMRRGRLRSELQALEADLAQGTPLSQAMAKRKLPELYVQIVQIGARANDLPGLLTQVADYYGNVNTISKRLTGLMVYPAIVLVLSVAFSAWAAVLGREMITAITGDSQLIHLSAVFRWGGSPHPAAGNYHPGVFLFAPTVLLAAILLPSLAAACIPALRREMRWRLPAFREASLARLASTLAMLLKAGCNLTEALSLAQQMESGTSAGKDLARWKSRCAEGHAKFSAIAAGSERIPPMFVWMVSGAGENLTIGFERAARLYRDRADYRTNVLLYAALPVSLLVLGLVILAQIFPIGHILFDLPRLLF